MRTGFSVVTLPRANKSRGPEMANPTQRDAVPYRLAADTFGSEELHAGKAVLDSGRLTMGERVRAFEQEFADWTGSRHAVMVNSGSSANLLMVDAMLRRTEGGAPPWRRGDEILVPALAWPTTVWPLVQLGLVPVFVDVDARTLAIDLSSAESVLSSRTRGMFLIHVLGQMAQMNDILRFCREHGLELLEDSCESLGAHFDGRHAGTFGTMSSFSFYFSHHISSIEGGMVTTADRAIADERFETMGRTAVLDGERAGSRAAGDQISQTGGGGHVRASAIDRHIAM